MTETSDPGVTGEPLTQWASTVTYRPSDPRKDVPRYGDPCPVCGEPFGVAHEVYAVTEIQTQPLTWVCWRHVGRSGPVVAA